MRKAETVLAIIKERGIQRLPLEDIYRQLYNPDLYVRAYGRIYGNDGAMTKGITNETVDGMSMEKIGRIIEALRFERYRWTPARRVNIPKMNGKTRPLGIPTWSDKLLEEVIRSILEAYYEPQFSDASHGFRPRKGCHTALEEIKRVWTGTIWFIEGDIKGCYDNIDHETLLSILSENLKDNRFLNLIKGMLKAGYCEDWKYHATLSGTPQGGVVSPLLSNIYLDRLDQYIAEGLLPIFNRGERRDPNPDYQRVNWELWRHRKNKDYNAAKEKMLERRKLPSQDMRDPNYRRLRYIRYADDILLGFAGPRSEAEEIKEMIGEYLRESLKLELSTEKTLITHAAQSAARFLGYEITTDYVESRKRINGNIALRIPAKVIKERCQRYMRDGDPYHRPELLNNTDFEIVSQYQSEFRGYVQYYALAQNLHWMSKVQWVMSRSLLKTLANKHQASTKTICDKLKTTRPTPEGPRKCFKVEVQRGEKKPLIAYFGGISLKTKKTATIEDKRTDIPYTYSRTTLEQRMMAEMCEICGSEENIEVHHIRKMADLKTKGRKEKPLWVQIMIAKQRKTLVLCRKCHDDLHAGRPLQRNQEMSHWRAG